MSTQTDNCAQTHPAVRNCVQAWYKTFQANFHDENDQEEAEEAAAMAYAEALPPLFGISNIRRYIACVAHASAIGVMAPAETSRLLYAAQIAFSTCRKRPSSKKKSRSSSRKAPAAAKPPKAAPEPFPAPAHAS